MRFNKYFYLIIYFFVIVSFTPIVIGCSCKCSQQEEESDIPATVLKKSNEFIIANTGKDFFEKYIKPDFGKSKQISPNYFIAYRFIMPDKPYIDEQIQFVVDSIGNVIKDMDVSGIPNCLSPGSCEFSINEADAIKIAKENGLEEGIAEWKKDFIWSEKHNQYVWIILSTLSETKADNFRGSGKEAIIDPNTGELLALNEWNIR